MKRGRLWAVTCLFNPSCARSRVSNYRTFHRGLRLPLAAVELSFGERFSLAEGDADILIQLEGGSRMWQKERLLNIAVGALPEACDQVVWIDADILTPENGWGQSVSEALDEVPVIQPYQRVAHLAPQVCDPQGERTGTNASIVSAIEGGTPFGQVVGRTLHRAAGAPCCGHVWAARRCLLERHGLYDGCIVGGGDTAFAGAAIGDPQAVVQAHHMSPSQADRYRQWAMRLSSEVRGAIASLPFEVAHLWHGALSDRHGGERHVELASLGFNPAIDLAPHRCGAWQWARPRPDLEAFMDRYFTSRKEDGALAAAQR